MPNPARLATAQIAEAKRRWAMWALRGTEDCRAYEADFCKHEKTRKALLVADLVVSCPFPTRRRAADLGHQLVNNYAFTPPLNDKLSLLFLDLKEGTKIISLKPFVTQNFRLNDRTVSRATWSISDDAMPTLLQATSPLAILKMKEKTYTEGSVSWTSE
jgi:H3 lysine-79-specific histone-lysine N-methyltransferase